MYSAYIEQGLEPQKAFDEASHMAWVLQCLSISGDDCNHNFQII